MSSVIKVNASVYSRIGYGRTSNTNSFYMNGKFSSDNNVDNIQASMENRGLEYLFSVADNMVCDHPEQDISVSILRELGKFHERIAVSGGNIQGKIRELENRVNDAERLIKSFLEMNRVPADDPSWNMGFSGILLSDGQFVALSSGSGRIYMMREGMFRPLASETSRAKKEIDIRMNEDAEVSELELPGDEERGSVIVSDIYNIQEGDSFILLSDGLYQALGEEKIEDLLALRSDSTYIAYRLVEEALKRKTTGDVTALVVQVEKVTASAGTVKKSAPRAQSRQTVKTRVDKLNKAPAITYKYDRRNAAKYKSTVLVVMVIISVMLLFGLVFKMIDSLMKTGSENIGKNPSTTTASPTLSPTRSPGETGSPADDPDETVTPTPTPTSTPTPTPEEQIHVVQKGDSMSAITRKYYGDTTLLNKLCKYNNISDPDKIIQGQKIKIPPIEVLKNLN